MITTVSQLRSWGLNVGSRGVPGVTEAAVATRGSRDEVDVFCVMHDGIITAVTNNSMVIAPVSFEAREQQRACGRVRRALLERARNSIFQMIFFCHHKNS
jgi:hypothetical protein